MEVPTGRAGDFVSDKSKERSRGYYKLLKPFTMKYRVREHCPAYAGGGTSCQIWGQVAGVGTMGGAAVRRDHGDWAGHGWPDASNSMFLCPNRISFICKGCLTVLQTYYFNKKWHRNLWKLLCHFFFLPTPLPSLTTSAAEFVLWYKSPSGGHSRSPNSGDRLPFAPEWSSLDWNCVMEGAKAQIIEGAHRTVLWQDYDRHN